MLFAAHQRTKKNTRARSSRHLWAAWRFHLLVIISLLLLLPATIFYALFTSNHSEFLRRLALLELHDALQRHVSIGAIVLDLHGRLSLQDVVIAERDQRNPPFFAARQLEVIFDPLQLVSAPHEPLSALRRVALERPLIRVQRDARGIWNFDDLLKLRTPPNPADRFHGEVTITDGEVYYHDAQGLPPRQTPTEEHLLHLGFHAQASSADFSPFRLSAVSALNHFASMTMTGGLRVKSGSVTCQVQVGQADLGFVQHYLDPITPITLYGGHANSRLQLAIAPNSKSGNMEVEMTLVADLTQVDGLLRLRTLKAPFHFTSGQLRMAHSEMELVDFQGQFGGVPAICNGTISHFDDTVIGLQVKIAPVDVDKLTKLFPVFQLHNFLWTGQLSGWVQLTGRAQVLEIAGHITGPTLRSISAPQTALTNVRADINYSGDYIELSHVTADAIGGTITGHGWVTAAYTGPSLAAHPSFIFAGQASGVSVPQILALSGTNVQPLPTADPPVEGTLSGPFTLEVTHDGDISLLTHAQGAINVPGAIAGSVAISAAILAPTDHPMRVELSRVDVQTLHGTLHGQGALERTGFNLALQGSELNLRDLSAHFSGFNFAGTCYLSGQLQGVFQQDGSVSIVLRQGVLHVQDGSVNGLNFANLSTQMDGEISTRLFQPHLPLHSLLGRIGNLLAQAGIQSAIPEVSFVRLRNLRVLSADARIELAANDVLATPDIQGNFAGQWQIKHLRLSRTPLSNLLALAGVKLPTDTTRASSQTGVQNQHLGISQISGFVDGAIDSAEYPSPASGQAHLTMTLPKVTLTDGSTMAFDSLSIAAELLSRQRIHLTAGALLLEGSPGKVTHINLADGYLTPQEFSLHLSGEHIPLTNHTMLDDGKGSSLAPDGRFRLPVELGGSVRLDAVISGRLDGSASIGEALQNSFAVTGTLIGEDDLAIGHTSFKRLQTDFSYRLATNIVEVNAFILSPNDHARDYALILDHASINLSHPLESIHLRGSLRGGELDHPATYANFADLRRDLIAISDYTVRHPRQPASVMPGASQIFAALAQYLKSIDIVGKGLFDISIQPSLFLPPSAAIALLPYGSNRSLATDLLVRQAFQQFASPPSEIDVKFIMSDLQVDRQPMPGITGDISYDTAKRQFVINHFVARPDPGIHQAGGLNPAAEVEVAEGGIIGLPTKAPDGNVLEAGLIQLHVDAKNIDPGALAHWIPQSPERRLSGEMNVQIDTVAHCTTSEPQFQAVLDWHGEHGKDPTAFGFPFQSINAIITLETDPDDPTHNLQRLLIGPKESGDNGVAMLQLTHSSQTEPRALELSGYVPVRWIAPLKPAIPSDKPFNLILNLPAQGLDSALSYLVALFPHLPLQGESNLQGRLALGGTLAEPEFRENSFLKFSSPQLIIPAELTAQADTKTRTASTDEAPPVRITDVRIALAFSAHPVAGHPENLVELRQCSAFFDYNTAPHAQRSFWARLRRLFGAREKAPILPALVAQGGVRILTPVLTGGWMGLVQQADAGENNNRFKTMLGQLRFDLDVKALQLPTSSGSLTAYLHLGNDHEAHDRPRVTGVVYAEGCKLNVNLSANMPQFNFPTDAFDPEFSVLVQAGEKNHLLVTPQQISLLQPLLPFHVDFTLAPTTLEPTGPAIFAPDTIADSTSMQEVPDPLRRQTVREDNKLFIDAQSPVFGLSALTLPIIVTNGYTHGTYGAITGSLSRPIFDLAYVLVPGRSQVQFPGGLMMVQEKNNQPPYGLYHLDFTDPDKATLSAYYHMEGSLDQYVVAADLNHPDLLEIPGTHSEDYSKYLVFSTISTPPTLPPLDPADIATRLMGVTELATLLQAGQSAQTTPFGQVNKPQSLSNNLIGILPNTLVLNNPRWMQPFAQMTGLQTVSADLDQSLIPETSFTTFPFRISKYSEVRGGASRNFAPIPIWRFWATVDIPSSSIPDRSFWRFARNFALTGQVSNDLSTATNLNVYDYSVSLQYSLPFVTGGKKH